MPAVWELVPVDVGVVSVDFGIALTGALAVVACVFVAAVTTEVAGITVELVEGVTAAVVVEAAFSLVTEGVLMAVLDLLDVTTGICVAEAGLVAVVAGLVAVVAGGDVAECAEGAGTELTVDNVVRVTLTLAAVGVKAVLRVVV